MVDKTRETPQTEVDKMTETLTRDLQGLVKALYAEADMCEALDITKPAALLREAAAVIQPEANAQTMDLFAEATSSGHLAELVDSMRMSLHHLADEWEDLTEIDAPPVAATLRKIAGDEMPHRELPAWSWRETGVEDPYEGQEVLAAIRPYGNAENRLLIVHAVYVGGQWLCPAEHKSLHAPGYWMPAPALPDGA